MGDWIIEQVLDEGQWLTASMLLAAVFTALAVRRGRRAAAPTRLVILQALNLFFGCTIAAMSAGHLLAVTTRLLQGSLEGSPWVLYPLGLLLAVPSWWLALGSRRFLTGDERWGRRALALNATLLVSLLALGLHNFPLALPALLNLAYQLHSRRAVGWAIVTVSVAANSVLFVGSLVFLASGQSFEQFKGM